MAKAIIMPKFGFTQEDAEVVALLKNEGDTVRAGDPLMEVTTDKVNMEVEAPVDGVFAGLRVKVGDVVPVTEVIAYILAPGEALPDDASPVTAPAAVIATETTDAPVSSDIGANATPVASRMIQEFKLDAGAIRGSGPSGRITRQDVDAHIRAQTSSNGKIRATPAARRLSRELDVSLAQVKGSGPRGRVQGSDVEDYARTVEGQAVVVEPVASPATEEVAAVTPAPTKAPSRRIPFTSMRRAIARNLTRSYQEAPHITFQRDVDMTALQDLVVKANQYRTGDQAKVTVTAALAKVVAWALLRHPLVNSQLGNDEIILNEAVNIGIAVALEDGLIVPVVRDVPQKGIQTIATDMALLTDRARKGTLKAPDLADGTFTISNLGMLGIDRFTAIINPPQVAILAVGTTKKRFIPDENDAPVLRPICSLVLSVDHRVVDGAVAARFMADVAMGVEEPRLLVL